MFEKFTWERFNQLFYQYNESHHCYINRQEYLYGLGNDNSCEMFIWQDEKGRVFATYSGLGIFTEPTDGFLPHDMYNKSEVDHDGNITTCRGVVKLVGWICFEGSIDEDVD